ncbi:MAG: cytochrome c biogenesis protein CcsA [Deltaproteobacteria bacterium]|nr:cytochrome c biogenesis protein CcsA [Deltaproteobacteria bacterium]
MRFYHKFFVSFFIITSCAFALEATPSVIPVKTGILDSRLRGNDSAFDTLRALPIQHGGRLKPLDTFAREAVQNITGKTHFNKFDPVELVFSWYFDPTSWKEVSLILITSLELKEKLGLVQNQKYFSLLTLENIKELNVLIQNIHEKNQREEKLSPFEKNVESLATQMIILKRIFSGELLTLLPHPTQSKKDWVPLHLLSEIDFLKTLYTEEAQIEKLKILQGILATLKKSYLENNPQDFELSTLNFKHTLANLSLEQGYPYTTKINQEIFYNRFRPFRFAWIFYLVAFIFLGLFFLTSPRHSLGKGNPVLKISGLSFSVLAFLTHVLGFYLRCSITGHAPVGNMYESVVWVSLGVVFFGFILLYSYKNFIVLSCAAVIATIGLILADNLPIILNPTIQPLAPVLRSNFWLTIHVLTITLSYSAFALACGLGNWTLFKFIKLDSRLRGNDSGNRGNDSGDEIKKLTTFNYRSIQIGTLLLAAGTILGGVWADYSWGRFWGWDPKEVWALIALLFYLAVIHGKKAGWLQDFGIAAGSVLAFQGVLMAWYGVNFILGVGLHSYGFGSGGLSYVLTYLALQIIFIFYAWKKTRLSKK